MSGPTNDDWGWSCANCGNYKHLYNDEHLRIRPHFTMPEWELDGQLQNHPEISADDTSRVDSRDTQASAREDIPRGLGDISTQPTSRGDYYRRLASRYQDHN